MLGRDKWGQNISCGMLRAYQRNADGVLQAHVLRGHDLGPGGCFLAETRL